MGFPVLAAAIAASSLVSALTAMSNYQATKQATDYAAMYYGGADRENSIFWRDYQRAHGWSKQRQVRYAYRTGYNYNLSPLYNAGVRQVSSKNSVYRSLVNGIVPFAAIRGGGYRSTNNYPAIMYG